MKKKFLSLMMAAAVVATTSVSAFAAENDVKMPDKANVISQDDVEGSAQVEINGNIQDENGNDAPSTFKVTVPTAANFTVNQKGVLVGPTLTVKNQGSQSIQVLAKSFSAGKGNIKVVSESAINTDKNSRTPQLDRTSVSLKLTGNSTTPAYLGASNGVGGVYEKENLQTVTTDGILLTTLNPGTESTPTTSDITLTGVAGKKSVKDAVSDSFTLTLKIKKVTKGAGSAGSAGSAQGTGSEEGTGSQQGRD